MVLYIHDWRLCLLGVKHDNLPSEIHEMSSLYQESCSVTHDWQNEPALVTFSDYNDDLHKNLHKPNVNKKFS